MLLLLGCDNGRVRSWGEQGYSAIQILRRFYGQDMYINTAEEISGIPASWPGYDLDIGASGQKVRQLQEQLNTIAEVYSSLPRVDILILWVDGVARIREAIAVAFPKIEYQRCIVHQV